MQLSDSGFIISGVSHSVSGGNKTAPLLGQSDYWVVRVDKNGNELWDKKYGGLDFEDGSWISKASDSGFVIAGESVSGIGGDKTQSNLATGLTPWIIKIDLSGNKLWDKTLQIQGNLNGSPIEKAIEAYPNCYYFISSPTAGVGGDKSQDSRGGNDYWISKWRVDFPDAINESDIKINTALFPNPTTSQFTIHSSTALTGTNSQFMIKDINIYNVLGEKIYSERQPSPHFQLSLTVDVSDFSAGVYFVQVSDGTQRVVLKFVKE